MVTANVINITEVSLLGMRRRFRRPLMSAVLTAILIITATRAAIGICLSQGPASRIIASRLTPENKVEGCVSQVWVKGFLQDDGTVTYKAESDSQLTKGLAALLVKGLSGATPEAITSLQPSFIEMLGLQQSLTPSRNNGFLNMLLKMQKIAHGLASDGDAPMSRRIHTIDIFPDGVVLKYLR